jgi:hypothetical protein
MRQIIWIAAQADEGPRARRLVLWFLFWPVLLSLRTAGLFEQQARLGKQSKVRLSEALGCIPESQRRARPVVAPAPAHPRSEGA